MALPSGAKLGPYEILAPIGAGGMGEVYRAKDTRLHRTVAIKILPPAAVGDEEKKKRFLQEARAASALNHPNIVTLHDIAADAGVDFLVMEYVEGKSLDKRISPTGIPLDQAADFAARIAGALAAAHAAGIVHRDIKPGNIMVTEEGQVKVLDFGLAKLTTSSPGPEDETVTQAPTLTEAGQVMGTAAYMSPEQAMGRPVDHRTDIFSLGAVLYEMLSGLRPFRGKSRVEVMHAVVHDSAPPLPQHPPEASEILAKALAKDPKERYQHAADFALDLRRVGQAWKTKSLPSQQAPGAQGSLGKRGWAVAIGVALLLAMGTWWLGRRTVTTAPVDTLADVAITPFTSEPGYQGEPTFAPDGQTIAYVSNRTGHFDLFLRQIGSSTDVRLTKDQGDNVQPSFSPDGRQIAFVSSRSGGEIFYPCCDNPVLGGDVWVMPTLGGSARRVAIDGNLPSWSPDGSTILYVRSRRANIYQVSAAGGAERILPVRFESTPPLATGFPIYSGDGRWIFFNSLAGGGTNIYSVPAAGGVAKLIAKGRHPAWDQASQSLVYSNIEEGKNDSLWALPFSTKEGRASGPAHPLTVGRGSDWRPAISRDGKLVAFTALAAAFNLEVAPFDAEEGRVLGPAKAVTSGNQIIYFMRFAPDGRSVVFQSARGAGTHIWREDLGAPPVQLTFEAQYEDTQPQWSPDGTTIVFTRQVVANPVSRDLWLMAADGGNPRRIVEGANASRWLPDGSGIVYQALKGSQLFLFDLKSSRSRNIPTPGVAVTMPGVSMDGKWVVYQSVATGGNGNVDVGAVPLDGGPARVVLSTPQQDLHPFLSPSGRWLYFQINHKNLYRVPGPAQDWKKAEPAKITDFAESGLFLEDPQISRDGRQLLFSRANLNADIWILRRHL